MDAKPTGTTEDQAAHDQRKRGFDAAKEFYAKHVSQQLRDTAGPLMAGITDDKVALNIYGAYCSGVMGMLIGDFASALGPDLCRRLLRDAETAGLIVGALGHMQIQAEVNDLRRDASFSVKH